jgi:hypothetical protein
VVSVDPRAFTPRNVMQLCSAWITTPTACGSRMSWIASAISAVSLQPTGEPVDYPRQLGDAHHSVCRQVTNVRTTGHRQHVMPANADHADVLQHHQLVVTADFLKGALK